MVPMLMICTSGDNASYNGVVLLVEAYSLHPEVPQGQRTCAMPQREALGEVQFNSG